MRVTAALLKQWREAATVTLFARASKANGPQVTQAGAPPAPGVKGHGLKLPPCDYNMLVLERSGKSSFMPSAYVFPGGGISASDHSDRWRQLYSDCGVDVLQTLPVPNQQSPDDRSPMFTEARDWSLPADVAFRICAIRETFEEAGILLCKDKSDVGNGSKSSSSLMKSFSSVAKELNEWRHVIQKDDSKFHDMCQQFSIVPDIWSLNEWSNWLTPTNMEQLHSGRRYDTAFYVCGLHDELDPIHDAQEIVTAKWCQPAELMEKMREEKVWLAPPQIYEFRRFLQLPSFEALDQFCKDRAQFGCQQWMPVRMTFTDGMVACLPGDDLYPSDPDWEGKQPAPDFKMTLEESLKSCKNVHRFEFHSMYHTVLHSNVAPVCGHLFPLL